MVEHSSWPVGSLLSVCCRIETVGCSSLPKAKWWQGTCKRGESKGKHWRPWLASCHCAGTVPNELDPAWEEPPLSLSPEHIAADFFQRKRPFLGKVHAYQSQTGGSCLMRLP